MRPWSLSASLETRPDVLGNFDLSKRPDNDIQTAILDADNANLCACAAGDGRGALKEYSKVFASTPASLWK